MTDRQIRCFLALYETLNFSAAARQLFLTQPTLSYQIRTLEEELGTPLFTRTTCRVEPTEAGQLFAAFAQNVRQSYQAFQHALAAGPARREKLVLQVPLTMASRDLVYHDLLLALSQELPDCDLEVRTDTSCTSPEEVLQSGVDALVQMLLEPVSDAIDCLPLFDTKCHLLASPGSPLSACGTLTPDLLAGQTICFESCDAVFVSMVRRCMEDIPLRWLMVPDFEKEYVRMLAGKCLFLSPVRSHGYPPEWFHPLIFPFPPAPTCLFTRKDDTRPCLQVLRQLTLAEHRPPVKPRHITFMLFQDCTDWCKAHGKTIGQLEKAGWTNTYSTASGCKSHFPCKNSKEPPRMGRLFLSAGNKKPEPHCALQCVPGLKTH